MAGRQRRRISAKIDVESPAFIVIDKFGGRLEFCRLTGYASSTVYDWLRRGLIPVEYQANILALSIKLKRGVRPGDFVPRPEPVAANG